MKNEESIQNFFHLDTSKIDSTILSSINPFEGETMANWSNSQPQQLSDQAFSGRGSFVLDTNSFSPGYSIPLDSLPVPNFRINADCWIKAPDYHPVNKIHLVISLDNEKGNLIWKSIPIDVQLIDNNRWNNIFNTLEMKREEKNCILKVFVWNTSREKKIFMDDFKVLIQNLQP